MLHVESEVTALDANSGLAVHVQSALERVRAVLARSGVAGVVVTTPGSVAWVTGGLNAPIDRSAGQDVVWLAVGPQRACVLTTNVEEPRLLAEHAPHELGLDLRAVPWWDPSGLVAAAADELAAPPSALGSDGHAGFGADLSRDLTRTRMALDPWEQDKMRGLGRDAATAVQSALRAWHPGEDDRAVAARIAAAVERAGACAPVLLVGGDDRLRRFRHPVAAGRAVHEIVMAVLVASRDGQHVALTRYAATAAGARSMAGSLASVRRVHRRVLAASVPGATAGDVLTELARAYADEGVPDGWAGHYQGGPIGYAQREFEIAPVQVDSPWWTTVLPTGAAFAWNPSLPGGAKDEDTYLIRDGSPEAVTLTPDWPVADELVPARPAVLVAGAVNAAGH